MYRSKTNKYVEIIRARSRLVLFGYLKKEGIPYVDTFAATPNPASTRLLLATAVEERLPLSPFDTEQAFLRSVDTPKSICG